MVAESSGGTMVATLVVALLLLCLAAGTEASPELSGEWGTGGLGTTRQGGGAVSQAWLGGLWSLGDPMGDALALPQHPKSCPGAGGEDVISSGHS